jgi:hypothetical protein
MNPQLKQIEAELDAKVKQHAPEQYASFKKTVVAGDKIMFDPKTHQHMELVKNPNSRKNPVNTVANGVSGLMWVMYMQSRKTMRPEVLIMAGTVLLMHAIDFAERGLKIQFTPEMIGQATKTLAYILFKKLGISEDQLAEAIQKGASEIKQSRGGQRAAPEQPAPEGMLAKAGGM